LNSFFPPLPSEAFNKLFQNLLNSNRRFHPVSVFCAVTANCPFQCWHCSAAGRVEKELTTEQWMKIISELNQVNTGIIGFTGGEPLLRDDLPHLIRAATKGGAHTILFTSGYSFNAQKGLQLKEAGLYSVCVSLDSASEEEHNQQRGHTQAYKIALDAVKIAKQIGFYTMIGAIATRDFIEQEKYLPLYQLSREYQVDEIRLVEPMPCGKLGEEQKNHLLSQEHILKIRNYHKIQNKKGRLPRICAFNQIESPELLGCTAGLQHMYINSNGEVSPCDFIPLGMGNAVEENFELILKRMQEAINLPRAHCLIQQNYPLIEKYNELGYPLPLETSLEICSQLKEDELPGYYKMVLRNEE
ncbi:MAG: radical SAM protein, partial [Spirochaetes bacterium]|nr:radical SAM protein [Spirochaetota bacterium]